MLAMCTPAQPEPVQTQKAEGFHRLARARGDWSQLHGDPRARRRVEQPISVDHDAVGNGKARSPGA